MTKEFYGTYCKDKNELPFVTLSGSVFLSGYHRAQWLLRWKNILQLIVFSVKKFAFILAAFIWSM
jgi:cytochrome c oxidase subunit IV